MDVLVDGRIPDRCPPVVVRRSPVRSPPLPAPMRSAPLGPEHPGRRPPVPWWSIVGPLLSGAVMAVVFSPLLAVLAGASALVLLLRWSGELVSYRRTLADHHVGLAAAAAFDAAEAGRWMAEEAERRRATAADPAGPAPDPPWQFRAGRDAPVVVPVGRGALEVTADHVDPAAAPRTTLSDVPVVVPLATGEGIAVVGDREAALAAAGWIVTAAVECCGPADLVVDLVTTADRLVDWDHLKWLPHLGAVHLVGASSIAVAQGDDSRLRLVVVDGVGDPDGPLARLLDGSDPNASVLWTDDGAPPAVCGRLLEVHADGTGRLVDLARSGPTVHLTPFHGSTDAELRSRARALADHLDPAVGAGDGPLPDEVAVAGLATVRLDGSAWADAGRRRLPFTLGVGAAGDATLDLVRDGPHALVAGTTGAGKSELLLTMVATMAAATPPTLLSFVLVDFKGGGAFDRVAALPHVADVVTDLDAASAHRALRSLRAELLARERCLRAAGLADLADGEGADLPGRLVVIVDEFAALADELPTVLDGLIDVARRGRSLGVHLVLATQRPAGVVTGQVQANVNLRICLRVKDRGESIDVIDRPDAAALPAVPGRAIVTGGPGDDPAPIVQVARLDGEPPHPVQPHALHPASIDDAGRAELAAIRRRYGHPAPSVPVVERIRIAAADAGFRPAEAPWVPAPTACRRSDLPDGAFGLLDDVDERRLVPIRWERDSLLVAGIDLDEVAATLEAAWASTTDGDGPVPSAVVLSARRARWRAIAELEPIVDVVGTDEPERLLRAIVELGASDDEWTVVVDDWRAVATVVQEIDPGGPDHLDRLVRHPSVRLAIGVRSDRDLPARTAAMIDHRLVHRLADPGAALGFGLRPADLDGVHGDIAVEPGTARRGRIARLASPERARLAVELEERRPPTRPRPVRVLGDRVAFADLPPATSTGRAARVPVGVDTELRPLEVVVETGRPLLVLGSPGSGRTTTLGLIQRQVDALDHPAPVVIDDADLLVVDEVTRQLTEAAAAGRAVVVGATVAASRRFGSPIASLVPDATVLLLNPRRSDGDIVRVVIPDLSAAPVGRAVAVDRGRVTVAQLAA